MLRLNRALIVRALQGYSLVYEPLPSANLYGFNLTFSTSQVHTQGPLLFGPQNPSVRHKCVISTQIGQHKTKFNVSLLHRSVNSMQRNLSNWRISVFGRGLLFKILWSACLHWKRFELKSFWNLNLFWNLSWITKILGFPSKSLQL